MNPYRVVIYHEGCYDGFGSAFAAWLKFGDDATYLPAQYSKPPVDFPEGAEVYMIDFSYPRDVIEKMAEKAGKFLVLDHHKTAQAALEGLPYATFDMERSGAVMAWQHFHPGTEIPPLFQYLQDRDLWRFDLPNSREVDPFIKSFPFDFEVWKKELFGRDPVEMAAEGRSIMRYQTNMVEFTCRQVSLRDVGGHVVPTVNATAFFSEVGEYLCKKFPEFEFGACFWIDNQGQQIWSLRSRSEFDVSQVAKKMGGGGHKNAAGFTVKNPDVSVKSPLSRLDA